MSPLSSCPSPPQWRELIAHRFEPERPEPEGWSEARDHLERCDACRETAVEHDPTLLFQRLAAPMPALEGADEVTAMRQAVTALRRAEGVEQAERDATRSWSAPGRWAAAAGTFAASLVAIAALSLGAGWSEGVWGEGIWGGGADSQRSSEAVPATATRTPAPFESLVAVDFGPAVDEALRTMPVFESEGLDESAADPMVFDGEKTTLLFWGQATDGPLDV